MIKVEYIFTEKLGSSLGHKKKFLSQQAGFEQAGITCKLQNDIPIYYHNTRLRKVLSRLQLFPYHYDWRKLKPDEDTTCLYIRKPHIDRTFYAFLRHVKRTRPNVMIILELPTYPYDKEMNLSSYPYILKERFWRKRLYPYVDYITTFSKDTVIWRIPCLRIKNGIVFDNERMRRTQEDKDRLDIITVSGMKFWHGYERIIQGLITYYAAEHPFEVNLHMVGDGPELAKYKLLSAPVAAHVIFHGRKEGEELDAIYDLCDVAADCFGCQRKDLFITSTQKCREYASKGVPIVTATENDAFLSAEHDYVLKFPEDESEIDIQSIVVFYRGLIGRYGSVQALAQVIRYDGERTCDISQTLQPVVNAIQKWHGR